MSRRSRPDPALQARVIGRRPLLYTDGPDLAIDRPAHVRAASTIVCSGSCFMVFQDDAHFIARLENGRVDGIPLPSPDGVRQFGDSRHNKHGKADLEAGLHWPAGDTTVLLGIGSGSTPARRRWLAATPRGDRPRWLDATSLYLAIQAALPGVDVNIEGALRTQQGDLLLFQRGNGHGNVDATLRIPGSGVDALLNGTPFGDAPIHVESWDLGSIDGESLGFTDATSLSHDTWLFSAAAEASPDAVADGPVTGSAVGWANSTVSAWAPLTDGAGRPSPVKLEGLCRTGSRTLIGVLDVDDEARPSDLLEIELHGPWPGSSR